ncbi:MAG: pyridoxamine 5'-phosphate oxidase family protein [Candidatus Hodarchaeales archaeon]|jgi:hypothetical protein
MKKQEFSFSFIEKKVRSKTFGILTTLNGNGTPHSTGILYGVSPPSSKFFLYFLTAKKYKKVRNIRNNPYISFIIPFPHYYIRFVPSGTVTFNGKVSLLPPTEIKGSSEIKSIFSRKRVLKLILKEIETQDTDLLTFGKIVPHSKVLCHSVGYNILKLRKGHKQGGYSVLIPPERLI